MGLPWRLPRKNGACCASSFNFNSSCATQHRMDDDIDEEIRKERLERDTGKAAFSINSVSFDEDFYGGKSAAISSGIYNTEINDDDDGPVYTTKKGDKMDASKEVVRKALNSYTAPKHLLESRPVADVKQDQDDPFKDFKRKTVAEREDEYRARWRKRKLSPPRVSDPFKGAANSSNERSYKEIMMEQNLDRERHDILIKIQKKKADEEKERQRDMKERNGGTLWDVKDESGPRKKDDRRSSSSGGGRQWVITIVKRGETIGEPIPLNPSGVLKIGRDRSSDIALDHPSCSKNHASIKFQADDDGSIKPHLFDHGSTNGTVLNGITLEADRPYVIRESDIAKFGASTREYMFAQK